MQSSMLIAGVNREMPELRAVAWDISNNYSDIVYMYAKTLKTAVSKAKKDLESGWYIRVGTDFVQAVEVEIMDDELTVLEVVRI